VTFTSWAWSGSTEDGAEIFLTRPSCTGVAVAAGDGGIASATRSSTRGAPNKTATAVAFVRFITEPPFPLLGSGEASGTLEAPPFYARQ